MRILNLIVPIVAAIILLGCVSNDKPGSTTPKTDDKKVKVVDTVIHSVPDDYASILDTISSDQIVKGRSYQDLLDLYESINYTPESWKAGIREIPRVYQTKIGERWGDKTTKEITVQQKKQIFFRAIAPLILRSNELIMKDRSRLEKTLAAYKKNNSIPEMDQIWILKLAKLYKVKSTENQVSTSMFEELWKRVDIVPPSLALGQAAEESGWGTSRFAAAGNAVYGQWTWGENAMVPEQQRKELGNYGIASFDFLQESVCGYMLNLNTHNAYADLRTKRAELRKNGEKITGPVLAEQLTKYSERGEDYVKGLKSLMDYNHLLPVDDAFLSNDPPIFVVPVED